MYKLILIDDEPMIAENLSLAYDWQEYGFKIAASFTNGSEAMEYIRTNPVDALITDVKMPNISGIDIARQCYESYPHIGVVLISAYKDFEYAHKAIRYNVVDYILKPIHDDVFEATMKKLYNHVDNLNKSLDRPSVYSKNMIINEAIAYIHENYSKNITAENVAKHVMLSPEYFGAYFKKHFGENFIDFLRKVRMEAALKLLEDQSLTVSAISEMVGYKSTTHFYTNFQNQFGLTPSQYRKQKTNDC